MGKEGALKSGEAAALTANADGVTGQVIGAAIAVHRALGPGLLESAYEKCLCLELQAIGVPFRSQVDLPITYRESRIESACRVDLLVAHEVIVEVKAVEKLLPVHDSQVLTYLRLSGLRTGLLLNFHQATLREGIRRLVL